MTLNIFDILHLLCKGWVTFGCAVEGRWYWVTDGKNVWIAKRDKSRAGGWCNEDTWENFDGRVIARRLLFNPRPPFQ